MKSTTGVAPSKKPGRSKPVIPVALEAPEVEKPCAGSKLNIELLEKIKHVILSKSANFDMAWWGWTSFNDYSGRNSWGIENITAECGTTACIAGWACLLDGGVLNRQDRFCDPLDHPIDPPSHAAALLGINDGSDAVDRLFHTANWPTKFRMAYNRAALNPDARAKATADRIDFFVKTCGTDKE